MTQLLLQSLSRAMNDLTTERLQRLLAIQKQIEKLQQEKADIIGGASPRAGKRKLSTATRKKLSQKLKAVWAKRKAEKG